jgi:catechol 2,3-dioxygenase-like lactoylglutathione lyase family enzyme
VAVRKSLRYNSHPGMAKLRRRTLAMASAIGQTPRIAVPHLFRVILPVSDIEAAASLYARLLGMPGTRVSGGRHYFDCAGTILTCFDALADGDPEPVGPNPQYVYFSVDDLDAAYERAREAGCQELTDIEVQPWGERSFYARDPFQNPICFVDSQTLFTGEQAWAGMPPTT